MSRFEEYVDRYSHVRLRRDDGVIEVTLHTAGNTLVWGRGPHEELARAFRDIGADPDNRVVILTGAGDRFIEEFPLDPPGERYRIDPAAWNQVYWEGKHLLHSLLDIEVPVIGAVNGPVNIHAELAVLSDIVLAAEHATFQDAPHFPNGRVPGDGVQVVWPALLGLNRGRYFLLTGQELSAAEAHQLGVVNEVLPRADLLPRAWEHARRIASAPQLASRYARVVLTQRIKALLLEQLGYGLALQGLAFNEPRGQ